ncbi:uncharacterized protein AKAME5_001718400 [Lates japonicus]|uniref:Uncharacterized protein n=1 Tax=Lates japonicus TaxID=270547 RepID=A0AAD3N4R5_LATJO|nr:uncharacterized protein AKAME5_001718400 [Lates japonicus]
MNRTPLVLCGAPAPPANASPHRILEELYARNITVPSDLSHEELFESLCRCPTADIPNIAPPKRKAVPLPADVTPQRTLGTAVPAPTMGSSFLPAPAAIPDSLRNHILAV